MEFLDRLLLQFRRMKKVESKLKQNPKYKFRNDLSFLEKKLFYRIGSNTRSTRLSLQVPIFTFLLLSLFVSRFHSSLFLVCRVKSINFVICLYFSGSKSDVHTCSRARHGLWWRTAEQKLVQTKPKIVLKNSFDKNSHAISYIEMLQYYNDESFRSNFIKYSIFI